MPPLIVTLILAEPAQSNLEAQRRRYFPAALNHIPAHISLFHHLPGAALPQIEAQLHATAAAHPVFPVRIGPPYLLGRGVAYRITSPVLLRIRESLAALWHDWLTPQDRQGFRPHVTIQNKVAPDAARDLQAELERGFQPQEAASGALALWHYLNGPWQQAGLFHFAPASGISNTMPS